MYSQFDWVIVAVAGKKEISALSYPLWYLEKELLREWALIVLSFLSEAGWCLIYSQHTYEPYVDDEWQSAVCGGDAVADVKAAGQAEGEEVD